METLRSQLTTLSKSPRALLAGAAVLVVLLIVAVGVLSNPGGAGGPDQPCPTEGGTIGWAQAPTQLAGRVGQTWYIGEDTPVRYGRSADGGVRCALQVGDQLVLVDAPVEEEGGRWIPVIAEALTLAERPADPGPDPQAAAVATPSEPPAPGEGSDGATAVPAAIAPAEPPPAGVADGSGAPIGAAPSGVSASGSGGPGTTDGSGGPSPKRASAGCSGAKGSVVGYIRLTGPLLIPRGGTWALMSDREVLADRPRKENGWKTRHPVVCRLPAGSKVVVEREPIKVGESGRWVPVIAGSVRGP